MQPKAIKNIRKEKNAHQYTWLTQKNITTIEIAKLPHASAKIAMITPIRLKTVRTRQKITY